MKCCRNFIRFNVCKHVPLISVVKGILEKEGEREREREREKHHSTERVGGGVFYVSFELPNKMLTHAYPYQLIYYQKQSDTLLWLSESLLLL